MEIIHNKAASESNNTTSFGLSPELNQETVNDLLRSIKTNDILMVASLIDENTERNTQTDTKEVCTFFTIILFLNWIIKSKLW